MGGERLVYRVSVGRIVALVAVQLMAAVVFVVSRFFRFPGSWAPFWAALVIAAACGFLLALALRAVTVVDDEGIEIRQLFGARRYAWREITDLRILAMPGSGALGGAILVGERRLFLPQVTDVVFGAGLADEVAYLRQWWEEATGRS